MKNFKVVIFIFTSLLLGCKGGEPSPPYIYESNPHYSWGYAEFYGPYYATAGVKNNVLTLSLFSDSLELTKGYGQYLFLEDVFVSPLTTKLIAGRYTVNETAEPFSVFAGKNVTVDGEIYPIGAYITYYEQNSAKSKINLISSGFFDLNVVNDSVYNIVCDFKTADSMQLKGTYVGILNHVDQSLAPKTTVSRNRFLKSIFPWSLFQ